VSLRGQATATASGNTWTGRELLVWGGQSGPHDAVVQDDGAAYDPADDTWRRLAPSPRPQGPPLNQHLAWTGSRLLVWTDWERLRRSNVTLPNGQRAIREEGRDGVDVWAYDPAADRWAVLGAAPGQPALGGAAMVWTGREVLSLAGRPYHGPVLERDPGSHYDLARNCWRPMADGPLGTAALPAVLWTGAALLVWNGEPEQSGGAGGGYQPGDGAAWDPLADRWLPLPRSPLQGRLGTIAVWTGDAALVWGGTPSRTPSAGTGMVFTAARS
jgi:hypothetical protein